jgi:hypothetical protein
MLQHLPNGFGLFRYLKKISVRLVGAITSLTTAPLGNPVMVLKLVPAAKCSTAGCTSWRCLLPCIGCTTCGYSCIELDLIEAPLPAVAKFHRVLYSPQYACTYPTVRIWSNPLPPLPVANTKIVACCGSISAIGSSCCS